jgi:hypothetical protein
MDGEYPMVAVRACFRPPGAGEKRVTKEVSCRADPDLWEAAEATQPPTRPRFHVIGRRWAHAPLPVSIAFCSWPRLSLKLYPSRRFWPVSLGVGHALTDEKEKTDGS